MEGGRGRWKTTSSSLSHSILSFSQRLFFFYFFFFLCDHLFNIAVTDLENSNYIYKKKNQQHTFLCLKQPGGKRISGSAQNSRIKFSSIIEELTPGRFVFTQALRLDNRTPNQSWCKSLHSNLQGGSSWAMWAFVIIFSPLLFYYCLKA